MSSEIVRATVVTNSSDDASARVKVKSPLLWDESPLMPSVNGIPLKKGDIVFVDVTDGVDNSYIVGRSFDATMSYSRSVNGSLLFESSNGADWTIAFVKNDALEIYNSRNSAITVKGSEIVVNASSVRIEGNLSHSGSLNLTGAVPAGNLMAGEIPVTGTLTLTNASYTLTK